MTRSELVRDMKEFAGSGWINVSDLAKYLGYKDRHSAQKYVHGLAKVGYKYAIVDVAENIMKEMRL